MFTCMNLRATSLKPLASKRLMISPTSPRWTPSGLTMMKVRSVLPDMMIQDNVSLEREKKIQLDQTRDERQVTMSRSEAANEY